MSVEKNSDEPPRDQRADRAELNSLWYDVIGLIRDHNIARFLEFAILRNYEMRERFFTAPGARSENPGHHAFVGGLAYHTLTAAKLAGEIVDHYRDLGMSVNKDIVVAGIVLHDVGKAFCYEWRKSRIDDNGKEIPAKYEHTRVSKLHHHIPIGFGWLLKQAEKFNSSQTKHSLTQKKIDHLGHIILSHHGRRSWSSPVIPNTIEAYIVHAVEMMDAFIDKYNKGHEVRDLYDH